MSHARMGESYQGGQGQIASGPQSAPRAAYSTVEREWDVGNGSQNDVEAAAPPGEPSTVTAQSQHSHSHSTVTAQSRLK